MRIIGIDPGTGRVGFGCIEITSKTPKLIDAGVITTTIRGESSMRLQELYQSLSELLSEVKPDIASVEKLFFAQNVTTAMEVSQARGVILFCLQNAGVKIAEYTPLQIKMAITGYGRAKKADIQEMVRLQLGLTEKPKPDDCADALAAALTHASSLLYNR